MKNMKPRSFRSNRKLPPTNTFRPWNAAILGITQEDPKDLTLDKKKPYENTKYAKYNLIVNHSVPPPPPTSSPQISSTNDWGGGDNTDNNNNNNNNNGWGNDNSSKIEDDWNENDNDNDWNVDVKTTNVNNNNNNNNNNNDSQKVKDGGDDDMPREITVKLSGICNKNTTNSNSNSSAITTTVSTTDSTNGKKIPIFVLIGENFVEEKEIKPIITPHPHLHSSSSSFSSFSSSPSSSPPSSVLSSSPKQSEQKLFDLSDDEDNSTSNNNSNKETTIDTTSAKKKRSADFKIIDVEGFLKQDLEEELKRIVNDLMNQNISSSNATKTSENLISLNDQSLDELL